MGRKLTQQEFIAKVPSDITARYDLSKFVYSGNTGKSVVVCPVHGEYITAASTLLQGCGCSKCYHDSKVGEYKMGKEEFVAWYAENGRHPLDFSRSKWGGVKKSLKAVCAVHGEITLNPHSAMTRGAGCKKCSSAEVGQKAQLSQEDFLAKCEEVHGSKYDLSRIAYTGSSEKIEVVCREHGSFHPSAKNFLYRKSGCPKCARRAVGEQCRRGYAAPDTSYGAIDPQKAKLELADYMRTFTPVVVDYKLPDGKHIDVSAPELKLGVEFHGLIWHSTRFDRSPTHIAEKQKVAAVHGIRVINIYSDEWADKPEQVRQIIERAVGAAPKTYARKLAVNPVQGEDAARFLNQNHIQGAVGSECVHYGLWDEQVLRAVMSFSRPVSARGVRDGDGRYELRRFASDGRVVGGASKLLKAFLKNTSDAREIISYSDNRLFDGGMYSKLGFENCGVSAPDYKYIDKAGRMRISKSKFQHKFLPRILGTDYDPALSEYENTQRAGWYRIYDCGKTRWVLALK